MVAAAKIKLRQNLETLTTKGCFLNRALILDDFGTGNGRGNSVKSDHQFHAQQTPLVDNRNLNVGLFITK